MAGRQLKELFRAFRTHDELAFRRAAIEIIEEEQAKHHTALAQDLRGLLAVGAGVPLDTSAQLLLPEPPRDREGDWALAEVRGSQRRLDDLVMSPVVTEALRSIVTEVRSWPELDRHGLPRRQRFLFAGPPGCGKTSAAEALASELDRPFVLVRLDSVVSSYLGETASNLRRVLEFAEQGPFVVLFDEFDSLGRSRDDAGEHGEMKRVVTAFLQMIDNLRGSSVVIAASNHSNVLDTALWRRFDDVLTFDKPTVHEIRKLLRMLLRSVRHAAIDIERTASSLKGLPHAAAEKVVFDARRSAILDGREALDPSDVDSALSRVTARPW